MSSRLLRMTVLSRSIGFLDRLLTQHAILLSLVTACLTVSWHVLGTTSRLDVVEPTFQAVALSHDEAPLTRASVLASSRQVGRSNNMKRKGATMRKAVCDEAAAVEEVAPERRLITSLEKSLQQVASMPDSAKRKQLLSDVYTLLANAYSAQGEYHQALHAFTLSIEASHGASNHEAVMATHALFGHMELKHHRYYAASTRFEDALLYGATMVGDADLVPVVAGAAWANVMQGKFHEAMMLVSENFHLLGLADGCQ
eukprot:3949868-Amphidinium_carterae.2